MFYDDPYTLFLVETRPSNIIPNYFSGQVWNKTINKIKTKVAFEFLKLILIPQI